jgi:hypothetical protein
MTRIMERECDGTRGIEGLPIPPAVLGIVFFFWMVQTLHILTITDAIENNRQRAISSTISMLTDLIGDYQNSAPRCLRKDDRAF